jgi:predicted metal-dependent peptidase
MLKELDIKKELIKSIISVVRHKEFYGHIVQQFEKVFVSGDHQISTAAVGRFPGDKFIKLIYNEDYFRGLYEEQFENTRDSATALKQSRLLASGATEHEILHVVLGHLCLNYPDKTRGNIAMDCVINQNIPKERRHESWIMPDRYGLPTDKDSKWYYDNLKDNNQLNKELANGDYEEIAKSHSMWEDLEGDSIAKEFLKDVIRKAKDNTSKDGWSDVGESIRESIDVFIEWMPPKVPWGRAFRNFCASSEESVVEYTMSRISRRFGTRPGTRRRDLLSVAVIVDTSGSISDDELKLFFNEVRWVWKNGAIVHVFEADTDVKNDYKFNGKFTGEIAGRGGTCLETPLTKVDKMRFDCIVYFTDFEANRISKKPRTPVMWVLSKPPPKEEWPCNWGASIIIDSVV